MASIHCSWKYAGKYVENNQYVQFDKDLGIGLTVIRIELILYIMLELILLPFICI